MLLGIRMVEQIGSAVGRSKDFIKDSLFPEHEFKTVGIFSAILKRPIKRSGKSFWMIGSQQKP
jgi:hypothetical protein